MTTEEYKKLKSEIENVCKRHNVKPTFSEASFTIFDRRYITTFLSTLIDVTDIKTYKSAKRIPLERWMNTLTRKL